MDIKYLHFLQGIRESAPEWFNDLIQFITDIGILFILIPMLIYFCIDKKKGRFVLISLSVTSALNVFIKNIFCVYRPWIRSDLIKPTETAIKGAGGYSFPSSHTTGAASSLGAVAFVYRKKKLIMIPCICLVLLVAFSRNYLGVHTPQDVLVALLESVGMIFVINAVLKKNESSDKGNRMFYIVTVAVTLLVMIFMCLKNYPVDYDAAGNILMDPKNSVASFTAKAGLLTGIFAALMLEEKFIDFGTDDVKLSRRIVRAVIGAVMLLIASMLSVVISNVFPIKWVSAFVQNALMYFIFLFFTPFIFTKIEARKH